MKTTLRQALYRVAPLLALSGLLGAGCSGHSDINIEGAITAAGTMAPIEGASVLLSYRPTHPLDPGSHMSLTDVAGRYTLHAANVPCRSLGLGANATNYRPAAGRAPRCHAETQQIDFVLQP